MYSGIKTFQVERELATYDEPNQPPFEHVWWYNDDRWDGAVYFPASTNAMDALMTFNVSIEVIRVGGLGLLFLMGFKTF